MRKSLTKSYWLCFGVAWILFFIGKVMQDIGAPLFVLAFAVAAISSFVARHLELVKGEEKMRHEPLLQEESEAKSHLKFQCFVGLFTIPIFWFLTKRWGGQYEMWSFVYLILVLLFDMSRTVWRLQRIRRAIRAQSTVLRG